MDATPEDEEPLEEVFGGPRGNRPAEILKALTPNRHKETSLEIPAVLPVGGVEGRAHFAEYLSCTRSVSDAQAFAGLNH